MADPALSAAVEAEAAARPMEITPQQRNAIFDRRAAALAAVPPSPRPADAFEALQFSLGEECYAFPSGQVSEVRQLEQLTALPSAPAFVAGLVNVRGRVVPVLDPRPLFGVAATAEPCRSLVLLSLAQGEVGVLASNEPGLVWLRASELRGLPVEAPAGLDPKYVRGVTSELVIVLDAGRLLADPRVVVQEEVS